LRRLPLFSAWLLALNLSANLAPAQNGATTTVTANPATITVGSSAGLAATVQPNNVSGVAKTITRPTGTITFLDGSTPLNTPPIALAPNRFSTATFQQTFGTIDPTLTGQVFSNVNGELVGDLNGDGVQDLFIYAYLPQFSEQTFTSNGKGGYNAGAVQTFSFSTYSSYPNVTNLPQFIDVNGDGKLDLLCGLQVAYGNGDGTFAQAVPVSFLSSGFITSYAADLNGDGKTDILAVNTIPGTLFDVPVQYAVTVFLNQGAGSFTSAGTFPVAAQPTGSYAYANFFAPAFVDLNGDGKLDLITQTQTVVETNVGGDPDVAVLLNNGDGTFASPMPLAVPDPPSNLGTQNAYGTGSGDVNGDGKQDLILSEADMSGNLNAIVLLGNGNGTFQNPLYLTLHAGVGAYSYYQIPAIVVQDVNLDGELDLVFGDGQLVLGNGDGTFVLSSPLFPLQTLGETTTFAAYPVVQMELPPNLLPSLVYFLQSVTPPPAAVYTPQGSSSASLSLTSLSVGAHNISARYSGDTNYAADTSAGVVVTVNQAASATAITSSVNPSFAGQSVTLTASVTSSGPTPTGNVVFTSGSTTLGTVALSGGTAAFTTSSFDTGGTQMITAAYSGDANTLASSAQLRQVVNSAFTLAPGTGGSTTLTVNAGQTVTAPINVTGAAGFSGQITFACTGLPANAGCSFSPATINVSGTPAVSTLLTVNTTAAATSSQLKIGLGAYGLAFAGLVLFWPARRKGARIWVLLWCAIGFATLGLSGCSGGSGSAPPPQTAAGTYSFTVVASSGNVKTQSAYTLVVQ
jgi:hypothetical protein